jgi:D-amino peptidase
VKILMLVDMEGASGICLSAQVSKGDPLYAEGRRYLTWDVNAAVEGCFAGGAETVVVRDGHGGQGDNVLWQELDPRADYLLGQNGRQHPFDAEDFDAVISLATHAMAGTPEAILEHTNSSSSWQNFWLNGRKTGEIGMMVYVAGERGIPMIMVSGDDKACREAEELVPGIVTACVKWGLACEGGRLLSAERAHALITEKATQAVKKVSEIQPVTLDPPITARLELVSRGRLPVRGEKPYVKIIDGRTYEVTGDTVQEATARL